MPTVLDDAAHGAFAARLEQANRRIAAAYPGGTPDRQPVHTVYGNGDAFAYDAARRLGAEALEALATHAPDAVSFAAAIGLDPALAVEVHRRVTAKLEREPVEDFRIDFEDGYGQRSDAEEDGHAAAAAEAMARGLAEGTLPPFTGIRIKPLTRELARRGLRTADLFVTSLAGRTGGVLPPHFVVTLAKVTAPEQVEVLADALEAIERGCGLLPGAIRLELMIETTQSVIDARGAIAIPALVAAARGRCRGAHLGVYDYTAAIGVTAAHQRPSHPACDFARDVMQACLAGTGVTISDGATHVLPVGPHPTGAGRPPLTPEQAAENRRAVHHAWREHYADVRRALHAAWYQGWDMHAAQLPTRFAAVYAFFLESRDRALGRLRAFVESASHAPAAAGVLDDAATGQALLDFLLRGVACGALTEDEALAGGLTREELRGRSFAKILQKRRA